MDGRYHTHNQGPPRPHYPPSGYGGPPPGSGYPPPHHMNGSPMHGGPPPHMQQQHGGPPPFHGGGGPPHMHPPMQHSNFRPPPMHHHQQPPMHYQGGGGGGGPPQFDRRPPPQHYDDRGPPRSFGGPHPPNRMDDRGPPPSNPFSMNSPASGGGGGGGGGVRRSAEEEKLTTVFVTGIAEGVTDALMDTIMSVCGPVRSWKRMQDASGKPKAFGFCIYEDVESVSRALRILNGEGKGPLAQGVELSAPGGPPKRLKCTADNAARKHVENYRMKRESEDDEMRDIELRNRILSLVRSPNQEANDMDIDSLIMSAVADGAAAAGHRSGSPERDRDGDRDGEGGGAGDLDDLPPEMAPEQRELITREISTFRERSAAKDRKKKEEDERRMAARNEAERRNRRMHVDGGRGPGGFDGPPRHSFASYASGGRDGDDIDEEEYERRQQRREQEAREAFLERERRWGHEEGERLRWLATIAAADSADAGPNANGGPPPDVEALAAAMAAWNDDGDIRNDDERIAFFIRTQRHRRSELEQDRADREAERAENERRAAAAPTSASDAQLGAGADGGADSAAAAPEPDKEIVIGKIMTREERTQAIQDLIGIIPAERAGLWEWHVKWEYLEESIVSKKIRPWVTKKIVEFIGDEDTELVEFVVGLLQKRTPAETLLEEMQGALDDEAEAFVMVLWRMLIYETEARSQGLDTTIFHCNDDMSRPAYTAAPALPLELLQAILTHSDVTPEDLLPFLVASHHFRAVAIDILQARLSLPPLLPPPALAIANNQIKLVSSSSSHEQLAVKLNLAHNNNPPPAFYLACGRVAKPNTIYTPRAFRLTLSEWDDREHRWKFGLPAPPPPVKTSSRYYSRYRYAASVRSMRSTATTIPQHIINLNSNGINNGINNNGSTVNNQISAATLVVPFETRTIDTYIKHPKRDGVWFRLIRETDNAGIDMWIPAPLVMGTHISHAEGRGLSVGYTIGPWIDTRASLRSMYSKEDSDSEKAVGAAVVSVHAVWAACGVLFAAAPAEGAEKAGVRTVPVIAAGGISGGPGKWRRFLEWVWILLWCR
ncbi:hypothetical protein HDU88_004604 [Geranomyces variabilis]|nr:hypothetical protein HDU88_004604 [Geranomyces variabilis]